MNGTSNFFVFFEDIRHAHAASSVLDSACIIHRLIIIYYGLNISCGNSITFYEHEYK